MAPVFPPLRDSRITSGGQALEADVVRRLAEALPDAYAIFHNVDWAWVEKAKAIDHHGEFDVVVVNTAGDVAILEIKAGTVHARGNELFKRYGEQEQSVSRQTSRQHAALLHRLRQNGLTVRVMHFLVLPHQRVGATETVAYPRERIFDAQDCQDLGGAIERRLTRGSANSEVRERVLAFLDNRFAAVADVGSMDRRLRDVTTRLSGGLAEWVPRIVAPHGVIRVTATAGSGKTQLALRLLRDALAQGQKATYVCFNRPLADHVRELLPTGIVVASFHQLCWEAAGRPANAQNFEVLAAAYCESPTEVADIALLVIDEVQDFRLEWLAALLKRVVQAGNVVLMDDPAQCLYPDRDELEIPEAVVVKSWENFRSPRRIVDVINALGLTDSPILACGVHDGELPGMRTWDADVGPERQTAAAVQSCLELGFELKDIAIVTWRGRERSQLQSDKLGPWRVSRFNGSYDTRGAPIWTDGSLRLETLRRIKGQSAAAAVFTEIDFESLGMPERRMLFVGMTRARMHLELVMSRRADAALSAVLSERALL
jgi:hypothetical protein